MANIHPTAIVASTAQIENDVKVGAYSIIHEHTSIGSGTEIAAHSIIHSYVNIGENNQIADHVILGGAPQDISYQGQETWLQIGNQNIFREFSSVHRSNSAEEPTRIGNGCYFMCNTHVGHNCQVGNEIILTAFAGLSGHVQVGDKAVIGGNVGIHQFCRIGSLAMVGGFTPVAKDVLPFCTLGRDPVAHYKLNTIGLRRAGITGDRYKNLEKAIRQYRSGDAESIETTTVELTLLMDWIAAPSRRGIYKFIRE